MMLFVGVRSCCSVPAFRVMVGGISASVDPGRESSRFPPICFCCCIRKNGCECGGCILGSICVSNSKYALRVLSSRVMSSNCNGGGGCGGACVCALASC